MQSCLIGTRNCCVSNYGVTIVYLYNNNKIINVNETKLRYILSCACVIPFKILSKFIKYYNYHIIYKMDNLYYTTNILSNHITPVIMNVTIVSEIITKKINLYIDTNIDTPVNIITNNSSTLIKNNIQSPVPMDMSPDNNMDCSSESKDMDVTIDECPDDKDITMVSLSGKKEDVVETTCDRLSEDITTNFRLYNNSIPLWVFIKNENINLDNYKIIKFKCMINNKIESNEINILKYINKPLYEIFISIN